MNDASTKPKTNLSLFKYYFSRILVFFKKDRPICNIFEIDEVSGVAIISLSSIETSIKITLKDLCINAAIIKNLSKSQAAWAGYSYQRFLQNSPFAFPEEDLFDYCHLNDLSRSNYTISSIDRSGNLNYFDNQNNAYKKSPLRVLFNKEELNMFSPEQAFFLGCLAAKNSNKCFKCSNERPKLELIKGFAHA